MSKKRIQEEIKKITRQLIEKYQPEKIILFGSAAQGKFGPTSDFDMLLVKSTNEPFWQRQKRIVSILKSRLPVDVFVLTSEEVKQALNKVQPFIYDIFHKGKVIYEQA